MKLTIAEGFTLTHEHRTILAQIKDTVARQGYLRQGWEDEPDQWYYRLIPVEVIVHRNGRIDIHGWETQSSSDGYEEDRLDDLHWNEVNNSISREDHGGYAYKGVDNAPEYI